MSEYSRVKKYEELRNSIEKENDEQKLAHQALEGLDNSKVKEGVEALPSHQKQMQDTHLVEATGEFKNEYLDSFIQEVREYNMKKGVRENEDTRLDILQQLSAKQREKRASYMEHEDENTAQHIVNDTNTEEQEEVAPADMIDTTREIARQVQALLAEEAKLDEKGTVEDKEPLSREDVAAKIDADIHRFEDKMDDVEETLSNGQVLEESASLTNNQLLEETLKLRTQLDGYEEELNTLNTGVDKNNRLLNIIITVLIVMLLAVIGVVVYWMINSRGIF